MQSMELERSPVRSRRVRRREALREIREELERVRRSEARVAEALGSLRAARHRVEELVRGIAVEDDAVRDIVREEVAAAVDGTTDEAARQERPRSVGGVRSLFGGDGSPGDEEGAPPASAEPLEEADSEEEDASGAFRLVGVAVASVLVIAAVAWFTVRALSDAPEGPSLTLGGDTTPAVAEAEVGEPVSGEPGGQARSEARSETFFAALPNEAGDRAEVYDSIWNARSPLFDPLLERLEGATSEGGVRNALTAWRSGNLTPLQSDLLHSALVQYALEQEIGADLNVDGQLLRNPCRGASCTALLNFWETRASSVGLPPVPEDAPVDVGALRVAENVLVLKALADVSGGRAGTSGR
jgi:hypothetical protein